MGSNMIWLAIGIVVVIILVIFILRLVGGT